MKKQVKKLLGLAILAALVISAIPVLSAKADFQLWVRWTKPKELSEYDVEFIEGTLNDSYRGSHWQFIHYYTKPNEALCTCENLKIDEDGVVVYNEKKTALPYPPEKREFTCDHCKCRVVFTPNRSFHKHKWEYSIEGTTLKAYCSDKYHADQCAYQDPSKPIVVNISAENAVYTGQPYVGAKFEGLEEYNEAGCPELTVLYWGRRPTKNPRHFNAPTEVGTYTLKVFTPAGRIYIDFEITAPEGGNQDSSKPEETAPQETTPQDSTTQEITPQDSTPEDRTPQDKPMWDNPMAKEKLKEMVNPESGDDTKEQ